MTVATSTHRMQRIMCKSPDGFGTKECEGNVGRPITPSFCVHAMIYSHLFLQVGCLVSGAQLLPIRSAQAHEV